MLTVWCLLSLLFPLCLCFRRSLVICREFRRSTTICGRSSAVPGLPPCLLIVLTIAALSSFRAPCHPAVDYTRSRRPSGRLWRNTSQSPSPRGLLFRPPLLPVRGSSLWRRRMGPCVPVSIIGAEWHNSQESLSLASYVVGLRDLTGRKGLHKARLTQCLPLGTY